VAAGVPPIALKGGIVVIKASGGKQHRFVFPTACPCCLEPTDSRVVLQTVWRYINVAITTTVAVPVCSVCRSHKERSEEPAFLPSTAKRLRQEAEAMRKPTCTGLRCIDFGRFSRGRSIADVMRGPSPFADGDYVFKTTNEGYAVALAALNKAQAGRVLSTSEID